MNRRTFLELWKALAALAVGVAALPTAAFWWRSSRPSTDDDGGDSWVELGSLRKLPEGEWVQKSVTLERTNRWRRETTGEVVWVRRSGDEVVVLSAICPHTGCLVRREDEGFTCPCHKSSFDADGRPTSGPSPRPLDTLEWEIDQGDLRIRYQRFRSGTPEKKVLAG